MIVTFETIDGNFRVGVEVRDREQYRRLEDSKELLSAAFDEAIVFIAETVPEAVDTGIPVVSYSDFQFYLGEMGL
jgi:hypothetical protein